MIFKYKLNVVEVEKDSFNIHLEKNEFVKDYLMEHSLYFKEDDNSYYLDYDEITKCFYDEIQIGDLMMVIEKGDVLGTNGKILTIKEKFFCDKNKPCCVIFNEIVHGSINKHGIFCGYLQFEPNFYKNKTRLKKLNEIYNKP